MLFRSLQDLSLCEILLRKPRTCNDTKTLAQHAKEVRRVGYHDDGFLNCATRYFGGLVYEFCGGELSGAGYAEEGGCFGCVCRGFEEGEV